MATAAAAKLPARAACGIRDELAGDSGFPGSDSLTSGKSAMPPTTPGVVVGAGVGVAVGVGVAALKSYVAAQLTLAEMRSRVDDD